MGFRQLARDCQAQPDSLCPGDMINLPELFEDRGVIFGRDSGPVVGDVNSHTVRTGPGRGNAPLQMDLVFMLRSASLPVIRAGNDSDSSERRRKLQCIIEKIGKDVLQLNTINSDRVEVRIREELNCCSSRGVWYLPLGDDLLHALIDVAKLLPDLDFARFQRAELEKPFNQRLQPERTLLHLRDRKSTRLNSSH